MAARSLQVFQEYLGIALQVVKRLPCCGQLIETGLDEALLQEPVGGLGCQDENLVEAPPRCILLQFAQQTLAAVAAAIIGVGNDTGQLTAAVLGEGIEGGTGNNPSVSLQ